MKPVINENLYELDESAVAEGLRVARHDQRMTLRDVAGKTGFSASTISRIERGHVGDASFASILALCNCYETTIDELLVTDFMDENEALRGTVDDLHKRVANLEMALGDLRRKVEAWS